MAKPNLIQWTDLSQEEIEPIIKRIANGELTIGEESDAEFAPFQEEAINQDGAQAFVDKYPVGIGSFNRCMIGHYCREAGVPLVLFNLEVAMAELKRVGLWVYDEAKPEEPKAAVEAILTAPVVAAQTPSPTAAEAKFLEKVKDDPTLNDFQRKARFEKLRRAAVAQRFANRTSPANAVR